MPNKTDMIIQLKAIGVDTDFGLSICQNNEGFYLKMFEIMLKNPNIDNMVSAYESGNVKATVDYALGIRGPMENLGVRKVYNPLQEIAFKLRTSGSLVDVKDAIYCAKHEYEKLKAVLNNSKKRIRIAYILKFKEVCPCVSFTLRTCIWASR